ncbi:hypothetical protein [Maritalea myrionectae]|uniref:hypothetical protein n=1 Tax=Maritalea myrionectae TaxID=454601 RepID=UPI000563C357|nr:hypothetical protein [Maritalea myrionectae]
MFLASPMYLFDYEALENGFCNGTDECHDILSRLGKQSLFTTKPQKEIFIDAFPDEREVINENVTTAATRQEHSRLAASYSDRLENLVNVTAPEANEKLLLAAVAASEGYVIVTGENAPITVSIRDIADALDLEIYSIAEFIDREAGENP